MAAKVKKASQTPLMKQYGEIKVKYPGALLLFRVGDFYELFGDDAIKASKILNITLTKRANGSASHIELAGFPHHALDTYLPKLVRAGERVAICDQLEDPKKTKTIVKRGVTELITPGVNIHDKALDAVKNNFLAAWVVDKQQAAVAFLDISTGDFFVMQDDADSVSHVLKGFEPSEVILSKRNRTKFANDFGSHLYSFPMDEWIFEESFGTERLTSQFKTKNLKGYGIENMPLGIAAAGAILYYLEQTHHFHTDHITGITRLDKQEHLWLDHFTIRNLELIHPNSPEGISLFEVINKTQSPMGGRLLRKWLLMPLINCEKINERLNIVEAFLKQEDQQEALRHGLSKMGDLERLATKLAMQRVNPRELLQLKNTLDQCNTITSVGSLFSGKAKVLLEQAKPDQTAIDLIENTLNPDAPMQVHKGGVIKEGVSVELDEYRNLQASGKAVLENLKTRESERTGIPSLKVAFNNVFGYYIEVTNAHKDKVPEDWIRKQTLVNCERYITPELKEYEEKILSAESKISDIEANLYQDLLNQLQSCIGSIQNTSKVVSTIDALLSNSLLAKHQNYSRPVPNDGHKILIKGGRHPVIEAQLPIDKPFVPNDIWLDKEDQQVIILTGPNMSGKSALLRQTALIVLLTQMGSFVPADHAEMGLIDKIYTRVGASDNISQGESTFMVEMTESAAILNNLSDRSLVLLDEIGRGTSTYDGVSLAWSIAEYLNHHPTKPKVIFATHYHELNELENQNEGIINYHISTQESGNKVIFLRTLKKGGTEHSFGIHVARMAGVPKKVVKRADQILTQLESHRKDINTTSEQVKRLKPNEIQMQLFQISDPKAKLLVEQLDKINLDVMTPLEALLKLNELKDLLDD